MTSFRSVFRLTLTAAALGLGAASLGAQLGDPNHETTTADVPGLTAESSKCAASTDPTYGLTPGNPIKTGGGDMTMAGRQVRFLSALRGPAGEGVHFKRMGSSPGPDGTILDAYALDIKGEHKTTLYVDGYRWSDPVAPVGFLCGVAMNLLPPGPDAIETGRQLSRIAVALGAAPVAPISIDSDGSKTHGVVYDQIRLIALAARAADAAGKPLDPNRIPPAVSAPHLVVVAGPIDCSGETIAPESVVLSDSGGNQPPSTGNRSAEKIAELSPGLTGRANEVAVAYAVPSLIAGARVTIHYSKPCAGQQDVVLPVVMTAPRVLTQVPAPPPPGKTVPPDGAKVVMQIFVAADGSAVNPVFASGAYEFTAAAAESLKGWKFEPSRVNTAPLYKPEQVLVVIK
jgi:hypothetical protein